MGSVHARGDTFLTFGLKALTETNTSRLATGTSPLQVTELRSSLRLVTLSQRFWCGRRRIESTISRKFVYY
jgi:hypothetical protein